MSSDSRPPRAPDTSDDDAIDTPRRPDAGGGDAVARLSPRSAGGLLGLAELAQPRGGPRSAEDAGSNEDASGTARDLRGDVQQAMRSLGAAMDEAFSAAVRATQPSGVDGAGGGAGGSAGDAEATLEAQIASDDTLTVHQFSVHERISSLFNVTLIVHCKNPDISFEGVVGQDASFTLSSGSHTRTWAGICNHIQQLRAEEDGESTYELSIVPSLWELTQRRNHRMFQQESELDIVKKLLGEWSIPFEEKITGSYKPRKYRVQYGESDFAFICRMLEDVGISFYFSPSGGSTLVLSDAPQSNPSRGAIWFHDDTSTAAGKEHVTGVRVGQRTRPGRYTLRDHDYRRPPSYKLLKTAEDAKASSESKFERFHYVPGSFLFQSDKGEDTPVADDRGKTRADEKEGEALAQKRLEAKRATRQVCSFATNAHDLAPGVVMSMIDHPKSEVGAGKKLLVVESSLSGAQRGEWMQHCEAVSADAPYRPALGAPKPKTNGVESATVVGPPGEEIHCDEFGRVRVHFHWDRESQMNDKSSCWIHVSQPWSGAGYGGINLPRVGQEVIVDFLGGDPDRPIIVGRVYTNLQKVPYKLPDKKTQSGWKSNSTPGGGGYNEIMFDDAAGKELVNIQAQKDLTKLTKNNETEKTGVNRTISVGNNRAATIGAVDSTLVGKQHTVTIAQPAEPPPQIAPTGTAMSDRFISQTTGESVLTMNGPDVDLTVQGNISINAGANISMSAGANIKITAATNIETSAGVTITNTAGVTIITTGGSVVVVKAGDAVAVEAKVVQVKGDAVEITATGPVDINGEVIDLN
ncbi:type VI secretion system Vgr family protein [Chondromyces apiculatus]|uniref:VgrG protein n=1 Tax=Chondromyces apiculatus DSM 436 TaxID=1192034 RepID=A0A017SVV0_9BACT|nr:type VI secretion system tip protein TssI/VgrG [Chondromyces apiculatus]EYF01093.1 VgrG protein [Chondromyces apiculatus DSM 436]